MNTPILPPAAVLAWSETELDACRPGDAPRFALWRPMGLTAAIGLSQSPDAELDMDAMAQDGVELVRRQSGGGAVLLGPGVWCWEAWAPMEAAAKVMGTGGIHACYAYFSEPVIEALRAAGAAARLAGVCDIAAVDGQGNLRKLAGMAQLRRRLGVLVHGCLLADADIGCLRRWLRTPACAPEYRAGRSHEDFCMSLAALTGQRDTGQAFAAQAGRAAQARGWQLVQPPAVLAGAAARMLVCKYATIDWNLERKRKNPRGAGAGGS